MLQPKIVSDLRLARLRLPGDPARPRLRLAHRGRGRSSSSTRSSAPRRRSPGYSRHDAEAYPKFEALMDRAARFVKPMMLREPPALGLEGAGRPGRPAARGGRMAGFSQARDPRARPRVHDVGRRPARRLLRARRAQGLDRVQRRGRRLGRPADPGDRLQPAPPRARRVRRDRGRLGPGDRRHGRDQPGDRALGARAPAPRSSPGPRSPRSTSATARAVGVTLADGTELRAPIVASGAHPKTTVLELAGAENFPAEIAEDMGRYRTRGASVKVNLVLSEPPRLRGRDRRGAGADDDRRGQHLPLDRLPRARMAGRDAAAGPPSTPTSRRSCRRRSTPRSPTTAAG